MTMYEQPTKIDTNLGTYVFRPYTTSDLPEVCIAWQAAYKKPLAIDLWKWKYHKAPHGHQIMICLHENGEVAALYGGIPQPMRWQGQDLFLTQLMDLFSHPKHRRPLSGRGGLFVETARRFFARYAGPGGSAIMHGVPGERSYRIGARRLQYERHPSGIAYLTAETAAFTAKRHFSFGARLDDPSPHALNGLDQLNSTYPPGQFQAKRDSAFARWRFLQHPQRDYLLFRYRGRVAKTWKGYAGVSIAPPNATIVDLILPLSPRSRRDMLRKLAGELASLGVTTMQTWLPDNGIYCRWLCDYGFRKAPEPLGLMPTIRSFDPTCPHPKTTAAFHFTMADADLF